MTNTTPTDRLLAEIERCRAEVAAWPQWMRDAHTRVTLGFPTIDDSPAAAASWWCSTCRRAVPPADVTNDERHDTRAGGCDAYVRPAAAAEQAEPLTDALVAVFDHLAVKDDGDGNAPGHSHAVPGIWDPDNGLKAGAVCGWCNTWARAKRLRAALATQSPAPSVQAAPVHADLIARLRKHYGHHFTTTKAGIVTGEHYDFSRHPLVGEAVRALEAPALPAAEPLPLWGFLPGVLRQVWTIPVEMPDGRIAKMRKCDLRPDDMVSFIDGDNLPAHEAAAPVAQAGVLPPLSEPDIGDDGHVPGYWNQDSMFAYARAALAAPQPNPWREAIDDELVTAHLGTADSFATPREALQALIDWHCVVSLDPAVSSDAALLVERGRADQAAYARRYRWLRNWWFGGASAVTEDRIHQALTMEELDAAIDAELGREGSQP